MGWGSIRGPATVTLASLILLLGMSSSASASFGITSFSAGFRESVGSTRQAGSHADLILEFALAENQQSQPQAQLREFVVDFPPGAFVDPAGVPSCTMAELDIGEGFCDPDTQVGAIIPDFGSGQAPFNPFPIYKMDSSSGQGMVLMASIIGIPTKLILSVRGDGDFGTRVRVANVNTALSLVGGRAEIWGVPQDPSHDKSRCQDPFDGKKCVPSTLPPAPFATLPARCDTSLTTTARARSWQEPERWVSAQSTTAHLTGCGSLEFAAHGEALPTTNVAASPTGLDVKVEVAQNEDPEGLTAAQLRETTIRLPEGMTLNPAGANGLAACSPAEIGLLEPYRQARFEEGEASCPAASRVGTVEVRTPLVDDPLRGSIYLAAPRENPFGSLFALYLTFGAPGVEVKLPGELSADPETGRLTASFPDSPQLPFESLDLHLFGDAGALLRTPATCGHYGSTVEMTPWSAPATGPPVKSSTDFAIVSAPGAGPCASSAPPLPFAPELEAGSTVARAGVSAPFVVDLRREDATGEFSALRFTAPPGLVPGLAGTSICSEGQLAIAEKSSANQELERASCPAGSEVGHVAVAAGAGPAPYHLSGELYLVGPYQGARQSLAAIVPVLAGPFDLGTVVIRMALRVDPETAQVTVVSDPLPTILDGVPLDLRSLSVRLDRPGFIRNPTSCRPTQVTASVAFSPDGVNVPLANRFQLGDCAGLPFEPRLGLRLSGALARNGRPALTAVLTAKPGEAGISRAALTLPLTELLEYADIRAVCSPASYAADGGGGKRCPPASRYGSAKAFTSLLDKPLEGPIYLRSNGGPGRLPDMVASLSGESHLDLVARTSSAHGLLREVFAGLPDIPLSKLVLRLRGGRRGLLVNTTDLCRAEPRARAGFLAHNGKTRTADIAVRTGCEERPAETAEKISR